MHGSLRHGAPYLRATAMALVLLATSSAAFAQVGQMYGEIVGKVSDPQGGVLPGVTVTLSGPSVMGTPTAVTNEQGNYRFPAVPSGTHRLTFEMAGFTTLVRDDLFVPVRTTVTVNVTLRLATLAETVTVKGESPLVDVQNTKLGERLDRQVLEAVPTQRTIFGAATTLPGMVMGRQDTGGVYSATSTGIVAHGNPVYNLNYFGVIADTPQDYGSMYYMDYDLAQEITVDTAGMGAEVAGGGGANINIIPKSGGNAFKGTFYFTGTGKNLAGNNVDDPLRAQGITQGTKLLTLYDTNWDLGGPLKRDRIWWYWSMRDFRTAENVIGFPKDFTSKLRNYTLRTTFALSTNNSLSAFWTFNRKAQPNRGAAVNQPPESTWRQLSDKNLENLNWTSVLGQNTFLEVSSSMFRMYWPTWYSDEWYALSAPIPSSYDITQDRYFGAEPDGERFRDSYRLQVNSGLTHYRDNWLGGSHQLKLGFETYRGWGNEGFDVFGDTRYRYRNGVPAEIDIYNTPLSQKTAVQNYAGFVQDRVTYNRLSAQLGLRYQFYKGWLPEQTGGGGRWFPQTTYSRLDPGFTWSRLLPRLGLAYKLTDDGRNLAKVNYSRYAEVMYTWYFTLINPNIIQTSGLARYRWFGDLNGNGVVDANEYNPNPVSVYRPTQNSIDPTFKEPKTDEISAGYQRELGANMGLSATWIQRWFTDNYADVNVGIPPSAYTPAVFADAGPDNIVGTGDDRSITLYNVIPAYVGKDAFRRQTVPGTQRYRGLELSFTKRMANRWQMLASYVWSRLDGIILTDRGVPDPNNPNAQLDSNKFGRGSYDQPNAFKLLGSYQAPYGINVGANLQILSGLPRDRSFRRVLTQGTTTVRAEPRGTYRNDTLKLLVLKGDKTFTIRGTKLSAFVEGHNLLNSNAGQNFGTLTQAYASQAAFDAANQTGTAYFGRTTEILVPRLVKFGLKFEF